MVQRQVKAASAADVQKPVGLAAKPLPKVRAYPDGSSPKRWIRLVVKYALGHQPTAIRPLHSVYFPRHSDLR